MNRTCNRILAAATAVIVSIGTFMTPLSVMAEEIAFESIATIETGKKYTSTEHYKEVGQRENNEATFQLTDVEGDEEAQYLDNALTTADDYKQETLSDTWEGLINTTVYKETASLNGADVESVSTRTVDWTDLANPVMTSVREISVKNPGTYKKKGTIENGGNTFSYSIDFTFVAPKEEKPEVEVVEAPKTKAGALALAEAVMAGLATEAELNSYINGIDLMALAESYNAEQYALIDEKIQAKADAQKQEEIRIAIDEQSLQTGMDAKAAVIAAMK